jgi:hypothetical protein
VNHRSEETTTMIREAAELSRLLIGPVYYGAKEEQGDGRVVMVIPGLFGGDLYLEPLRTWLRRVGYTAVRSTLTVNAGCPLRLRDQVQAQIAHWQQRRAVKTSLGVRRWAGYSDRQATLRAGCSIRTAIFRPAIAHSFVIWVVH